MSDAWSSAELKAIATWVGGRTGLVFPPSRVRDAEAGIRAAMKRAGASGVADFLEQLEARGSLWDEILDALTVRETYFFRDREQLHAIWGLLLQSAAASGAQARGLRVWSAGCASGEEPYTLAILLARAGLLARARVHGTDLSAAALEQAREGLYRRWSLRMTDPMTVATYFRPEGDQFRLVESIAGNVRFQQLNLASDEYPSIRSDLARMDLILCRNVLIYLDRETIARAARGLFAALAEGGWLVTSPSDPLLTAYAPFETVMTGAGVVYRRPVAGVAARESEEPQAATSPEAITATPESRPRAQEEPPRPTQGSEPLSSVPKEEEGPDAAAKAIHLAARAHGAAHAERAAASAIARHPTSVELRVLRASLLMELGRYEETTSEARAALYIDRTLVMGHILRAAAESRLGDDRSARRAYKSALLLCRSAPADQRVPFADGEVAGRIASAAAAAIARLGGEIDPQGGEP